jgi:hypothetical protein
MRTAALLCAFAALDAPGSAAPDAVREFRDDVRPVLVQNCGACHNAANPKGPANFLKANTATDVQADRGLWRNVAAQLRNRTMPPVQSGLTEADRLRVSQWIESQLRATACLVGDYAGAGTIRRLNRREYHNTIRDLLGLDFDVTGVFPSDGTGGAGFDTNGDTLYIQPLLMERYLEAAQQILNRVIVTPRLSRTLSSAQQVLESGKEITVTASVYLDNDYEVRASIDPKDTPAGLILKVDGVEIGALARRRAVRAGNTWGIQTRLDRGLHTLALTAGASSVSLLSLTIDEKASDITGERKALHYRLLGMEPGEEPLQPRKAAEQVLSSFLPRAFRRPVRQAELNRYLALYDRAAERGDPYEERIKLALKGALVSPDFLFRMEQRQTSPGIYPLGEYELATRLSYFLWSTMPDEQLFRLAAEGRLQDPGVLAGQVDRMLDDPRSRAFVSTFTGQWLGTQDIGGRFMPILSEIQSYYNADIASDLRTQPVLLLARIVGENRSVLDLLDADYAYMTQRLMKFYQLENSIAGVNDNDFHLVQLPENRRGGVLALAGVLGMTSHYEQTSPVLRGAWVLDTLLGTPVPPPPPDVPPLDPGDKVTLKLSTRERVLQHRANPACSACHKLMDPIGFSLENFDWMGRWREKERDGAPIDATGELPSGEKFNGPVELRDTLLKKKDEFVRQLTGKVLGYALGRSLQDGDSCTVQKLVDSVASDNYRARTMIREIVLSLPFRNTQGGHVNGVPLDGPKLNISAVTSRSQDAKAHDNGEALPPKR